MRIITLFFLLLTLVFASCEKDVITSDPSAKLEFSVDTAIFDTVFTTIGSATQWIKVYNRNANAVNISSIELAGGSQSFFRLNVDGVAADKIENLEVKGGDSIFVFAEVTVDPTNSNNPLLVTDSIVFKTNGNIQDVDLVAYGQDAYFHTANAYGQVSIDGTVINVYYHSLSCTEVWNNDKPHVVYGYAIVEPGCLLTVNAGTNVHFHANSGLLVGNPFSTQTGATLRVQGTKEEPAVFQGDRLEFSYEEIPNQWNGIILWTTSDENEIDYAIIKNANIGLEMDSLNDELLLSNTIIRNHSGAALVGKTAHITATNCVFSNAGQYTAALVYGGKYDFTHCTFANYWNLGSRTTPALVINNYIKDVNTVFDLDYANFKNCIIYGNNTDELAIDEGPNGGAFNYLFDHCVMRTDTPIADAAYVPHFNSVIRSPANIVIDNQSHDPVFNNPSDADFHLFEFSVAVDTGDLSISFPPLDLDENPRPTGTKPDLGAYEYLP